MGKTSDGAPVVASTDRTGPEPLGACFRSAACQRGNRKHTRAGSPVAGKRGLPALDRFRLPRWQAAERKQAPRGSGPVLSVDATTGAPSDVLPMHRLSLYLAVC